jgi:hypothetical protein
MASARESGWSYLRTTTFYKSVDNLNGNGYFLVPELTDNGRVAANA